jgi:hypothetical protein
VSLSIVASYRVWTDIAACHRMKLRVNVRDSIARFRAARCFRHRSYVFADRSGLPNALRFIM